MNYPWDTDRIEFVHRQWAAGLSASQIAAQLVAEHGDPITRNAVIGKLYRTGAPPRTLEAQKLAGSFNGRRSKNRNVLRPKRPEKVFLPRANVTVFAKDTARARPWSAKEADDKARVTFDGLSPRCCRWPVGHVDRPGFGFCGAVRSGGPYCPEHTARATHRELTA